MTDVTLITGDGVGPELAEATKRCIDATEPDIKWDMVEAGIDVMERTGTPLPEATIESVRKNGIGLKAPITTPVGTGFRSINVHLRQELDLYACLRPCKSYKGVRSKYADIDLVVVRENTEDLYAGIEFEKGKDDTAELINWLNKHGSRKIGNDAGVSIKPISVKATEKIVRFAFDYARKMDAKIVVLHIHETLDAATQSMLASFTDEAQVQKLFQDKREHAAERIQERLKILCEKAFEEKINPSDLIDAIEVKEGYPAEVILQTAHELNVDVIINTQFN